MHLDRTNVMLTRVEEGIIMKSDIDNKEVGKRLQNFREIRGLTRAVVALRLGMSEKDLEDVEAGEKHSPSKAANLPEILQTLANFLVVNIAFHNDPFLYSRKHYIASVQVHVLGETHKQLI